MDCYGCYRYFFRPLCGLERVESYTPDSCVCTVPTLPPQSCHPERSDVYFTSRSRGIVQLWLFLILLLYCDLAGAKLIGVGRGLSAPASAEGGHRRSR